MRGGSPSGFRFVDTQRVDNSICSPVARNRATDVIFGILSFSIKLTRLMPGLSVAFYRD
jgi:hypothetical protein